MRSRGALLAAVALSLTTGVVLLGRDGYLAAKAAVADVLIERALEAYLRDGRPRPPWSWADMAPIARLEHPRLGIERVVLTGATGTSLAFGVGHVDGTAPPNGTGHAVLAGHRDTVFRFLGDVRPGDRLRLTSAGLTRVWRVVGSRLLPAEIDEATLAGDGSDRLTLVTCWPLDGLLPSSLRYAVELVPAGRSIANERILM